MNEWDLMLDGWWCHQILNPDLIFDDCKPSNIESRFDIRCRSPRFDILDLILLRFDIAWQLILGSHLDSMIAMPDPDLDHVHSLQYNWHWFLWDIFLIQDIQPSWGDRNCRIVCGSLQCILGSNSCLLHWRRYKDLGNCLSSTNISDWLFSKSWQLVRMFPAIMPWPMTLT